MGSKDLQLFGGSSGGDLAILNNDISLNESLYQSIFIALFGGNIEASTKGDEIDGQIRNDYWANGLILSDDKAKQYNSETGALLPNLVLTSSNRLRVLRAVERDLKFLKKIATVDVDVSFGVNRVNLFIKLSQIPSQSNQEFTFIWDNAKQQIVIEQET